MERMAARVFLIGLGNMGAPIAANLAKAGFLAAVHDANSERAARLGAEFGVEAPGDLSSAAGCNVTILMLPNADAVRAVAVGHAGGDCLAARMKDALLIDMGSSDPSVYPEIEAELTPRGIGIVDAPVSGGVAKARAAALSVMCGGSPGAVARARPVLEAIGSTVFETGALGSGQAMKALNNLASAGALMLTVEILLSAKRLGLDPAMVNRILTASTGRNNATENKIAPFVLSRTFDSGFSLALMAKDLIAADRLASSNGLEPRMSRLAVEMAVAARNELPEGADHTEVARWLEDVQGLRLDQDQRGVTDR